MRFENVILVFPPSSETEELGSTGTIGKITASVSIAWHLGDQ
jgi:hypothetical protein